MRWLLILVAVGWLAAGCSRLPPHAPERFRDDPGAHGLLALDVAAGSLRGWALVLRDERAGADGTDAESAPIEITFRPADGARPARGTVPVARAVPPGTYRAVRVMAVEDGTPCGGDPDAPTTRAVYPARLATQGIEAPAIRVAAGQALYLGRLGLRADLFACDGPAIHLESRPGRPVAAGDALALPLVPGPPALPAGSFILRGD